MDETPERKPVIRNERGQIQKGGGSNNPGGSKQWVRDFRKAFSQRCAPMAESLLAKVLERGLETDILTEGMERAHAENNPELVLRFEREFNERLKQGTHAAEIALKHVLPPLKQEIELSGEVGNKSEGLAGFTTAELVELARRRVKEQDPDREPEG